MLQEEIIIDELAINSNIKSRELSSPLTHIFLFEENQQIISVIQLRKHAKIRLFYQYDFSELMV